MSIFDQKLIHLPRLFRREDVSREKGMRAIRELEARGKIKPDITPTGREYVSPHEADAFHRFLRRA